MNKRLRRPAGAAGSLFLIVHNVKQRDHKVQSSAHVGRCRACGYTKGSRRRGAALPDKRRQAQRITRASTQSRLCLRISADLWPSCLSAEGFARRRINPVVVTLVRVDQSPIGRPSSRAQTATRSVGSTTGRWYFAGYVCLCGASGSSSLPECTRMSGELCQQI